MTVYTSVHTIGNGISWSPARAEANYRKHGVRFVEAETVFEDDYAITITDAESDRSEERFVTLGAGNKGRLLVVVYTYRNSDIRIISARLAEPHEREEYEAQL